MKVVRVEVDELCLIPKVLVHHILDLVPDQNPEVVLEVPHVHDRVHDHNLDPNLDLYLIHDLDRVQFQNQRVNRDREVHQDQDPVQRRVCHVQDRVLDQDQNQEKVNHDQDRVVDPEKVDHNQDQDQVLQLAQGQDQDHLVVPEKQLRDLDQDQDQDLEVVHNQMNVNQGAKADQNPNLHQDRAPVQDQKVAPEVVVQVVQQGK